MSLGDYPLIDTIHKFMYLVLNQTPLLLGSRQIGRLTSGFNWCKGLDLLFHLKPFPEKVGEKLLDFFGQKTPYQMIGQIEILMTFKNRHEHLIWGHFCS